MTVMGHEHGDHTHSRAQLMSEAERRCADGGETLTPLRRRVLELLIDQPGPAKAYDLLHQLSAQAKPPTIYRALDHVSDLREVRRG